MLALYIFAIAGGYGVLELRPEGGARAWALDIMGRLCAWTGATGPHAIVRARGDASACAIGFGRTELRKVLLESTAVSSPYVSHAMLDAFARMKDEGLHEYPEGEVTPQPANAAAPWQAPAEARHDVTPPAPVRPASPPPGWPEWLAIPPEATALAEPQGRPTGLPPYLAAPPEHEQAMVAAARASAAATPPAAPPPITPQSSLAQQGVAGAAAIPEEALPPAVRAALEAQRVALAESQRTGRAVSEILAEMRPEVTIPAPALEPTDGGARTAMHNDAAGAADGSESE